MSLSFCRIILACYLLNVLVYRVKCTQCASVVGQRILEDTGGVEAYLDVSDYPLNTVPLIRVLANDEGKISLLDKGGRANIMFRGSGGTTIPIPGDEIKVIPMHFEANRELYYTFSILSTDVSIFNPLVNVTPNTGLLIPGQSTIVTAEFCCKSTGIVVMQGCLTVGTKPFTELEGGEYVTVGPFYASYQCTENIVEDDCPSSLPLYIVLGSFCFNSNFTRELVESGGGSWGTLLRGFDGSFCVISVGDNGIDPLIRNPGTNVNLPFREQFQIMEVFFEDESRPANIFDGPVGYSISLVSQNLTILDNITYSIPQQGVFEDILDFTVSIPCNTIGVILVDTFINFSTIIEGNLFNNTFQFVFHRNCTPANYTPPIIPIIKTVFPFQIILPSTIIPGLGFIIVGISVSVILCYNLKRKQKRIQTYLKETTALQTGYTAYNDHSNNYADSLVSVRNPFDFLEEYNMEYNFALLEVVDRLGEGYFGHVYKATAPGLSNDFVAVKTLKDDTNRNKLLTFAKEAGTCVQFNDPNVIRLLGVCTHSVQKCMIFEYMNLGSLDNLLRISSPQSPNYDPSYPHLLKPEHLLGICLQLSSGLVHLSTLKFIHRDIAARNCLIDSSFKAKIADFGLSRNISAQNYYRIGNGKNYLPIRWMPPEALFYGTFTQKSDVWSFGILMWEIYTYGQIPFTGLSNHEVIDNIKVASQNVLEKPTLCSESVYNVMCSCWTRLPTKRPTIQVVLHNLGLCARDSYHGYVNVLGPPPSDSKSLVNYLLPVFNSVKYNSSHETSFSVSP